jgi:hypothetical protein
MRLRLGAIIDTDAPVAACLTRSTGYRRCGGRMPPNKHRKLCQQLAVVVSCIETSPSPTRRRLIINPRCLAIAAEV